MTRSLIIPFLFVACCETGLKNQKQPEGNIWENETMDRDKDDDSSGNSQRRAFEDLLVSRRSVRDFEKHQISSDSERALLFAAQGVTLPSRGSRSAPSAGATYPLEVYLLNKQGVYHYLPTSDDMHLILEGDRRASLAEAALGQRFIEDAAVSLVFTGVLDRISGRYGNRGWQYCLLEAGHAAQNVLLQAESMGLGSVPIGAFEEESVTEILGLGSDEKALYIVAVGYKKR